MEQWQVGDNAWFIVRNSADDGWFAVQRKIIGVEDGLYYGEDDIHAHGDCLCQSAAEAFVWISQH